MEDKIIVSEFFSSFQGEGSTLGKYSLFIRFPECNLQCNFCDTQIRLKNSRLSYTLGDIKNYIINEEHRNIIFTGGEPLLYTNQIFKIINYLYDLNLLYEIETNGIELKNIEIEKFKNFHFSISPKVSFAEKYKDVNFLNIESKLNSFIYKFVVNKDNYLDVLNFIHEKKLSKEKIYLMPICSTFPQYIDVSSFVLNLCKQYRFNFSTRLHIIHYFN